jgi:hypothetical protein
LLNKASPAVCQSKATRPPALTFPTSLILPPAEFLSYMRKSQVCRVGCPQGQERRLIDGWLDDYYCFGGIITNIDIQNKNYARNTNKP